MKVFTIGFTKTSAESFFERLRRAEVKRLVDVRLHNISQLAGFAKRDDLRYFVKKICNVDYEHRPELAPTDQLLDTYKKRRGDWETYEKGFLKLMEERHIETTMPRDNLDGGCLLCSEDKPHHCHRRLVAEYLRKHWGQVEIIHL
jgi:uncharacterized protein (DUF488 family)